MRIIGVIPARWKSSRFPGKPLADICGHPMIWWVYQQCIRVRDFDAVYVATDDEKILQACESLGMNAVMTSENCMTGTDRVGEVSRKIPADVFVNIQGDEPLLEPETIRKAIAPFYEDPDLQVSNLMTRINDPVDAVNPTIPKVITNREGMGIFLTRAPAPYPKGRIDYSYYKQVCVYGLRPEALEFFCEYGRKFGKAKVEAVEDIEILRFIENGYSVKYIEVDSDTIAVDTPKDLEKVRAVIAENLASGKQISNSWGGGVGKYTFDLITCSLTQEAAA
ncbi:MAG: 3-deoxy-manno-octulosonate cytidylyltransferase [Synergistaceae bacterium]|nr:3-deoxy-manno-octulosonate cytidylyltransferase [Synergistaceae bacterium]